MHRAPPRARAHFTGASAVTTQAPAGTGVLEPAEVQPVFEVHAFHRSYTTRGDMISAIDGSEKRRYYTVLEIGAIKTPLDAVRAAIVAESRQKDCSQWEKVLIPHTDEHRRKFRESAITWLSG
jgi:hypothetical protein